MNNTDNNKKRFPLLWTLIALVVFVILAAMVYWQLSGDKSREEQPEEIIDNRISPLENQGLIFEINRIRHRGLLEKLLQSGNSWREQPSYYFISTMDGLEYISKDVKALGSASEILYEGWDTMFQENKVVRDVVEENLTSDIKLVIMERESRGILNRKTQDVKKEEFKIEYDFRTGRWSGDDFFMDADGYGHYLGENFEIWFNVYQTDYDNDGIPYWTEVNILHTDPRADDSYRDPDEDGIPTSWEWKWGYDPHTMNSHNILDPDIDGLENIEEYRMEKWFANPFTQDMYIEVDNMKPNPLGIKHEFWIESQQAVIERFAQHGITMYIDNGWPSGLSNGGGEQLTYYKTVSQDSGMMLQYYNNHFSDDRKGIFRYYVVGHSGAFTHPSKFFRYDTTHLATSLFERVVYQHLAFFHVPTQRTQRITIAGQFMHETGHQLGITPWTIEGCDNSSSFATGKELQTYIDIWGNYYSTMNYYWLYRDKTLIDYSDGTHGKNDQNDWLEIYLPHFQVEGAPIIEDDAYDPPMLEKMINETRGFSPDGWIYSEELTREFSSEKKGQSPIKPINVNWLVFLSENDNEYGMRNARIYARPIFSSTIEPDSEWTLIYEGYIDEENKLHIDS